MTLLGLAFLTAPMFCASALAPELPALKDNVNDFAGMMPAPSIRDLEERLTNFKRRNGFTIVVLTVHSLQGERMASFSRKAFEHLQLEHAELRKALLLVVARKEREVGVQIGPELQRLFPEPAASRKLKAQLVVYLDGFRPDLGIHAAVHYIFKVIEGEFHVDTVTEEERLEEWSKKGRGGGAIFAAFFAPYLAFVVGVLWGIYATKFGTERGPRLFMGALLGGGTAKIVEIFMSMISGYGTGLWYFLLIIGMALGVLGSLTEYWMAGSDWSGIPRLKDPIKRKPEDNMGI